MKHNDINNLSAFDFQVEPVSLRVPDPVHTGEYCENAVGKKVLVRKGYTTPDGQKVGSSVVGVHSEKYHAQNTFDVLQKYNEVLTKNLDCSDVTVTDRILEGGRKARRTVVFNNYQFNVTENEKISLKLDLFNSFDGSWPWFSAFGAINSICMNGLVSAQFAMVVTRKHTSGFSLNAEIAKLSNAATMFNQDIEKFKYWTTKRVAWDAVSDVVKQTIAKKSQSFKQRALNEAETHSEPVLEYVMRESARLCNGSVRSTRQLPSVWDVYNAATHWSTHAQELRLKKVDPSDKNSKLDFEMSGIRKNAGAHNVTRERELKVAQMLVSKPWQQLAA